MKNMKKLLVLMLAVVMMFSFAACGTDDAPEEAPEEVVEPVEEEETNEVDFSGKTLNVVTTSESYIPLFEKFTEETGAEVEFLSMSSGEVISRVKAEGGEPMADLWFGGGIDAFMQAKEDGLLESHISPNSETVPSQYQDEEGYWTSKGLTVVGFLVNPTLLDELGIEAPQSWADLADPKYKDEIIMSNPAISGTNYAVVKGLMDLFGEEEAWDYFEQLNNNIPFYGKRGGDPQEKVVSEEFAIGIVPASKTTFDIAEENGLELIWPEDGIPWVPEGVAIFKNAQGADIAKAFIDFMFEDENQQLLAEIDGKDGAQMIKPGIEGYDVGLPEDKLIEQDLSTFGTQREAILERWQELTKDKESK